MSRTGVDSHREAFQRRRRYLGACKPASNSRYRALRVEFLEHRQLLAAQLVKDIRPGAANSFFDVPSVTSAGDMLYFVANDGSTGSELWKSDGTGEGTVQVVDLAPGTQNSYSTAVSLVGENLFFLADGPMTYGLWISDGTDAGTTQLAAFPMSSRGSFIENVSGSVYFTASDGASGSELWRSDGTVAGTGQIADINPGAASSYPYWLTNLNGQLLFSANDGMNGHQLWVSDGTTSGTQRLTNVSTPDDFAYEGYFCNVNGVLYFAGADEATGIELWRSDGTTTGTFRVQDIRQGNYDSSPRYLTDVGGTLYFAAFDGSRDFELWKSDGSSAGTMKVTDIDPGPDGIQPRYLENFAGSLYFAVFDSNLDQELWRTDGTALGTVRIADIRPGPNSSGPHFITEFDGKAYFSASDGVHGFELWLTDGTEDGTRIASDIRLDQDGSYPSSLANVGGVLFFVANDGVNGRELWRMVAPAIDAGGVAISSSTSFHPSYTIPTGSGEQLRTVPVARMDQISLTFGEDVFVDSADLTLTGTLHGDYPISGFDYDPLTFTATWTLAAPILADQVTLTLNADGLDPVVDRAGNRLDGEWDNPIDHQDPASSTTSGNGLAGGNFVFRFTVLAGDANRDNKVTGADYTLWANDFDNGQGPADKLFTDGDFNSDGHVTGADYTLWANHFGLNFGEMDGEYPRPHGPESSPGPQRLLLSVNSLGRATIRIDGQQFVAASAFARDADSARHDAGDDPVSPLRRGDHESARGDRLLRARQRAFSQSTDWTVDHLIDPRAWIVGRF